VCYRALVAVVQDGAPLLLRDRGIFLQPPRQVCSLLPIPRSGCVVFAREVFLEIFPERSESRIRRRLVLRRNVFLPFPSLPFLSLPLKWRAVRVVIATFTRSCRVNWLIRRTFFGRRETGVLLLVIDLLVIEERRHIAVAITVVGVADNEAARLKCIENAGEVRWVIGEYLQLQLPRLPLKAALPVALSPQTGECQAERQPALVLRIEQFTVRKEFRLDRAYAAHLAPRLCGLHVRIHLTEIYPELAVKSLFLMAAPAQNLNVLQRLAAQCLVVPMVNVKILAQMLQGHLPAHATPLARRV